MIKLSFRLILLLAALIPGHVCAAVCGGLNPVLAATTAVSFGNYSANAASTDTANGTITIACTIQSGSSLPTFTVGLSAGGSGSFSPRVMSFLTASLNYNLYTSASYTTVWGDGTNGTSVQSYNSSTGAASTSFTVFGSIPNHQYVSAGVYLDTITVTVTY